MCRGVLDAKHRLTYRFRESVVLNEHDVSAQDYYRWTTYRFRESVVLNEHDVSAQDYYTWTSSLTSPLFCSLSTSFITGVGFGLGTSYGQRKGYKVAEYWRDYDSGPSHYHAAPCRLLSQRE